MPFEYDQHKSIGNKEKHGIDFIQAQHLWDDPKSIVIPAKTTDESRYLLIGKWNKKLWSAIFTIREMKIRLISVRRARENEEQIYKS